MIFDNFGKAGKKIKILPSGMNNLTMLFNFQSERILNETLHENIKLLSAADENAKAFQKALTEFQNEVIRIYRPFGELGVGCMLTL